MEKGDEYDEEVGGRDDGGMKRKWGEVLLCHMMMK